MNTRVLLGVHAVVVIVIEYEYNIMESLNKDVFHGTGYLVDIIPRS